MSQATVTSKGQITIPASVRSKLKVSAGDKIEFVDIGQGKYEVIAVTREVTSLKGFFKSNKVVSIDEMNQAISENATKSLAK